MKTNTITTERLQELLNYDQETGLFTRRLRAARMPAGSRAGWLRKDGYIDIRLDGRIYRAHRLAWQYVHGESPPNDVDHINGVRDDNRIANLRLATQSENMWNSNRQRNNTSGFRGVIWHKPTMKWRARIRHNGKCISIGYYDCIIDAAKAYDAKARELYGEFYRSPDNDNSPTTFMSQRKQAS